MKRHPLVRAACVLAANALLPLPGSAAAAQTQNATLIRNATVIDGRGTPARRGDVRIVGARIVAVGSLTPTRTDRVVDAQGLALAPGFIDTSCGSTSTLRAPTVIRPPGATASRALTQRLRRI